MFKLVALLSAVALLLVAPATAAAGSSLHVHMTFTQVGAGLDSDGQLVALVNGILSVRNVGDEPTEALSITQRVTLPAFGLVFTPNGQSQDLAYNPVVDPGETACYGLGGYVPFFHDTAYMLSADVTVTNSRVNGPRTLTSGVYVEDEGGMVGHVVAPGWVYDCWS